MPTDVIKFHCPNCDKRLGVRVEEMHLSFVCPKCNRKIRFSQDALPENIPLSVPMNATTLVQGQETSTACVPTQSMPKVEQPTTKSNPVAIQLKKIPLESQKETPISLHLPEEKIQEKQSELATPKRRFIMPKKG